MPPLTKKRAKETASERLRAACATQYGFYMEENMAGPPTDVADQSPPGEGYTTPPSPLVNSIASIGQNSPSLKQKLVCTLMMMANHKFA